MALKGRNGVSNLKLAELIARENKEQLDVVKEKVQLEEASA
jgi:hypothetical protein